MLVCFPDHEGSTVEVVSCGKEGGPHFGNSFGVKDRQGSTFQVQFVERLPEYLQPILHKMPDDGSTVTIMVLKPLYKDVPLDPPLLGNMSLNRKR